MLGRPSACPFVRQLECVLAGGQIDGPAAVEISGDGGRAVSGCWTLLGQVSIERTPRLENYSASEPA